jgi:hypothetical protein
MEPECSKYQKIIPRYLLEDLTAEERQSLEAHLATCPHCREEQERYARTLQLMPSMDNESVPHHFFVYPAERKLNPWEFFRLVKPHWQVATAALACLLLLTSIGWVMSLSQDKIDVAALKKDILQTAEEKNSEAGTRWLQEVQAEIARSNANLTKQQKAELAVAFARLDSHLTGRLIATEDRIRNDTQIMAVNLYRNIAQERTQERTRDLNDINLRLDGIELKNAHETRQTDAILNTLLQVAEIRTK